MVKQQMSKWRSVCLFESSGGLVLEERPDMHVKEKASFSLHEGLSTYPSFQDRESIEVCPFFPSFLQHSTLSLFALLLASSGCSLLWCSSLSCLLLLLDEQLPLLLHVRQARLPSLQGGHKASDLPQKGVLAVDGGMQGLGVLVLQLNAQPPWHPEVPGVLLVLQAGQGREGERGDGRMNRRKATL